ncbi:MAG: hypothetical protein ACP5KW_09725 [Thermoproteota archaeon]|jgi:hypothetical protein
MSVITCIKNKFSEAVVKNCSELGCEIKLSKLRNFVVLKGEKLCQNQKICDCIIFNEDYQVVGIIELKSKTAHHTEILEKLINGSKVVSKLLEECNTKNIVFNFYYIVLCKKWNTSEYKVITSKKVNFKGKSYNIIAKNCGTSLLDILSTF